MSVESQSDLQSSASSIATGLGDDERHASSHYTLTTEGRRNEEMLRLQMQHRLLTRLLGNRLVFVNLDLKPGDKILDSATGAGSWAFDMASHIPPGATIDAIDIDSRLWNLALSSVPKSPSTRSFEFHQRSVLDCPQAWENRFALINQRLLVGSFTNKEWKTNVPELHRMLAPKGWVQLLDLRIIAPKEELTDRPHLCAFMIVLQQLWASFGLVGNPLAILPSLLLDSGFEDVRSEEISVALGSWAGIDGIEGADNWEGVFLAMEGPFRREGLVESGDALRRLVAAVRKEWDDIPGFSLRFGIVCGKKTGWQSDQRE